MNDDWTYRIVPLILAVTVLAYLTRARELCATRTSGITVNSVATVPLFGYRLQIPLVCVRR